MRALVTASELRALLGKPGVKLLDASYGLPPSDFRIGNAVEFDIDDVADPNAELAHTLPSPNVFAEKVSALGISNSDHVIVYDRMGISMAASRAWWMFRVFGHDNVQVLDGGLPSWLLSGGEMQPWPETPPAPAVFKATFRPELFRRRDEMLRNLDTKEFAVLDARDARRYSGEAPEARPGVESGHIPGSLSVPYATLFDLDTGLLKSGDDLKAALKTVPAGPVAISCGSGVTACVVALGLYELGRKDAAVYGGSWTEWGGDATLPKKKGSAP
jgi:thiosulfate/3-mercaptopyruvate sulfurtransferase